RHGLEAGGAGALDEDDVAALELGGEQLGGLLGRGDELVGVVLAGGLADTDEQVDPRSLLAGVEAYLPVIGRGARPELGHLAEDGDTASAAERSEVVERGPHRDRVGVVAVVHEEDPVAQLEALAPKSGEAYVRSAIGHLVQGGAERDPGG